MVVAARKLTIPTSRLPLVPRPALSARLDTDYRVGLVSAPAGYGKTAVLASWASDRRDRLAWLSCDSSDAEPTRFMSGLLSAIANRWPGVADDALVLLERDGSNTLDSAVAAANELAAVSSDGVIVVDDLHLAAPTPAILTAFVDALPPGFKFVIGTRADPPLSLGRLRLRGDLLEVRSDHLRFEGAEVSDFFQRQDLLLADDELARLHELTEGWPAGVQMAAIALRRGGRRETFLEAFSSTDRAMGDFLLNEVLAGLPPDVVDFLVRTSVLDSFDAELCRQVTGNDDAGAVLARLVDANLFVVALDDRGRWYRYHHLFGAFLRARLVALGEKRRCAAHDTAGRALEARGDVAAALHHAIAAGDVERAGEIVRTALGNSMSLSGGADVAVQAVRLWLRRYGAELVDTDPMRLLESLVALITLAGPDDVPAWLDRIQRAHPDADGELTALIEGAWAEHHHHRGQPLEAGRRLEKAMDAVGGRPTNRGLVALLHTTIVRAEINTGRLEQAAASIEHALSNPVDSAVPDQVRHPALASYVAALTGELSRAEVLASRAWRAADVLELGRHEPGRIFAGLARLEVQLERHDLDEAMQTLDEVTLASEASRRLTLQVSVRLHHARLARALGHAAEAGVLLEQTQLSFAEPDAGMRQILGEEAALQALRFDPSTARSVIDSLDPRQPATAVLQARLALLNDDARGATTLLAELPAPTSRRSRVEHHVLSALCVLARDVDQANDHLRQAVTLAQPERMVRTMIDQGPDVHRLLKAYVPDACQTTYVQQLLAIVERSVAPERPRAPNTLIDPLSDREVTVLRYLCSRLTYLEIAAALYVSVNTLKSHVRTVYRKLGVASRADAIDVGRSNGII